MKIHVTVKSNSKQTEVIFLREGQFKVVVTEPPTQNKANNAVIEALAEYFKLPKSLLKITRGIRTKSKTIEILNDQKLL